MCCLLLVQVHSLIGDYHTGLQCLFPLNIFDKTHLYTPLISSCHITLFYYSSFAYIMLQRYTDAGRCGWVCVVGMRGEGLKVVS